MDTSIRGPQSQRLGDFRIHRHLPPAFTLLTQAPNSALDSRCFQIGASLLRELLQLSSNTSVAEQGCAGVTRRRTGRTHSLRSAWVDCINIISEFDLRQPQVCTHKAVLIPSGDSSEQNCQGQSRISGPCQRPSASSRPIE